MKCPICGADNAGHAKTCGSCGSNLDTRGGADIVMRNDGTADHAGDSRWRSGAGVAGAGALAGLAKFGAFGVFFKFWAVLQLIRIASLGGFGIVVAVVGLAAIVGAAVYRNRRRLHV